MQLRLIHITKCTELLHCVLDIFLHFKRKKIWICGTFWSKADTLYQTGIVILTSFKTLFLAVFPIAGGTLHKGKTKSHITHPCLQTFGGRHLFAQSMPGKGTPLLCLCSCGPVRINKQKMTG